MQVLTNIGLVIVFILAVWKLYDLCFNSSRKRKDNKLANEQFKILMVFYAELTHKTKTKNKKYETAPIGVYNWLAKSYQEWAKERLKNNIIHIPKKLNK